MVTQIKGEVMWTRINASDLTCFMIRNSFVLNVSVNNRQLTHFTACDIVKGISSKLKH